MSNTVDERVVKMQFDNASFEKNVQTSLSTLASLKNALNFGKVDLSGIASNIEKITDKVTGMGGLWETVCRRMVNFAVDTGQKIAKAFVFDPPSDGFKEYELKMDSLKVIMESSHSSLEEVNKYLNDLNTYSDQTIYSFSDMTASIGKFTNAGVDLETSVNAIKGIANEAALAGASTQQASHAMYNFAQALSAGSVKLIDWKSIENANMATKDFKEELIKTAVELGTLKKSGDDYISTTTNMQGKTSEVFNATKGFNDSLQAQWMTTDVLTTTLSKYADATTDIGARATKAATEVRTFSAMVGSLKEAVGSGWAQTWELIFGDMEEATALWTSINDVLSDFIKKTSDARNSILQVWKDLGGRTKLIEGLSNVFHILGNVIQPIKDAITLVFPPMSGKTLADITNKFAEFTGKLREATEFFPMKLFGDKEIKGFGTADQRLESLAEKSGKLGKASIKVSQDTKKATEESVAATEKTVTAAQRAEAETQRSMNAWRDEVMDITDAGNLLTFSIANGISGVINIFKSAGQILGAFGRAWNDSFSGVTITMDHLVMLDEAMGNFVDKMSISEVAVTKFYDVFKQIFTLLKTVRDSVMALAITALPVLLNVISTAITVGGDVLSVVGDIVSAIADFVNSSGIIQKTFSALSFVLKEVGTALTFVLRVIGYLSGVLASAIKYVINYVNNWHIMEFLGYRIAGVFRTLKRVYTDFKNQLAQKVGFSTFDEFTEKADKVVETLKGFLIPAFQGFMKIVNDFARGRSVSLDIFKGVKGGISIFDGLLNYVQDQKLGKKIVEFYGVVRDKLGNIVDSFKDIFFKKPTPLGFLSRLIPFKKEQTFAQKLITFFGTVLNNLKDILVSFSSIFLSGRQKGGKGLLERYISLDDEEKSVSKIINFFNKARVVIHNAIVSMIDKLSDLGSSKNKTPSFASMFTAGVGNVTTLKSATKGTTKPIQNFIETIKNLKDRLSKVNVGEAFKKAFDFLRNDAIPNAIDFLCDAFGRFEMFIAKLDFKKLLLAAKTVKTAVSIFNGIKLAKSFSGMADSIGGFFDKLGNKFGKGEETKTTSLIKIAGALIIVAKAISIIASIPEDRLDSSVGVVAGIALVLSGLAIALGKIKTADGADLKATTSYAIGMAVSVMIIAKALETIGGVPVARLHAAEEAVFVIVATLTAATFALSKMKGVSKAKVAAPIGFAIALKLLADTIAKLGKIPEEQLKQGEKNIWKIASALVLAMYAIGKGNYTASSVFAPLAFATAVFMLGMELVLLSLIPPARLIKGGIVVKLIEQLLKSAMKSLDGVDVKAVAAPLAFAAGVYLIGRTVAKLGKMDITSLAKGVVAVGFIGLILVGCMKLLRMATEGSSINKSVLAGLVVVSGSILVLGLAMAGLGKLPFGQILKGGIAIGAIGAVLAGVMFLLSNFTTTVDPSTIGAMIVVTGMIVTLAVTAALIGLVPFGALFKGIGVIAAVGTILTIATMFISHYARIRPSAIFGLITVTASIVTLATVAAVIGFIPLDKLSKGVGVILAVAAILTAVSAAFTVVKVRLSNILAAIGITVAITALALTAVAIGVIPRTILQKGVSVVTLLGALLAVVSHELGSVKIDKNNIFALIAIVAGIQLLCFSVLSLGVLPLDVLGKGLGVISILSLLLTKMVDAIGKGNFSVVDVAAPLVLVAAVLTLAYAVVKVGSVDTGTLFKGTVVIGLIMAAIVLALKELSKIMGQLMLITTAVPGLLAFAAVIGVLSYIVTIMGSMKGGDLGKGLVGLIVIIGTMVAAFKVLAGASAEIMMVGAAFIFFGVAANLVGAAFIKVSTALLIFTQALMMFTTLKSAEQFTGLAVGMMALGAVLAVFIGMVVGFVAVLYTMPALIPPLLAFGAAILMIGGGLYLLSSAIEKFISIGGQIGSALAAAISSIAESAGQILSAIGTAISGAINFIIQNAPVFMAKAGELVKSAAAGIAKNAPQIASKVGGAISGALSWIRKNLPKWLSAGGELIKNIVSGIAKNAPKVLSKVGELISKALSTIAKNLPKWLSMGKDLVLKLISGLLSLAGKLASEAGRLIKRATEAIKHKVGEWKSIGKDMVSGLIGGIMSKAQEVANKARKLVSDAIEAAKRKLDSHSPSKVFIKIGEDIDNGLMIGVDKKAGMAAARTGSMAERVIEAAKGPFEQLADLLSGDIITDPTITPVIDLSEIQNGTDQLYAMMNEADRFSFHGNLDLAESTNRSVDAASRRKEQSQTETMNALVNAINGLTALIGNTGNTYNVNGVTYDDGSNVSSAVRSLIRAVRVEGRA